MGVLAAPVPAPCAPSGGRGAAGAASGAIMIKKQPPAPRPVSVDVLPTFDRWFALASAGVRKEYEQLASALRSTIAASAARHKLAEDRIDKLRKAMQELHECGSAVKQEEKDLEADRKAIADERKALNARARLCKKATDKLKVKQDYLVSIEVGHDEGAESRERQADEVATAVDIKKENELRGKLVDLMANDKASGRREDIEDIG